MPRYRHVLASYVAGLAVVVGLIATPRFSSFALANLATQLVLFLALAGVPARRTGLMSYVDIAWPCGLIAIGAQIPVYAASFGPAASAIAGVYLASGLRMAVPGVIYLGRHRRLKVEFARYRYQRVRWAAAGWHGERVPMQLEIFLQCLANASVLAMPAFLLATDRDQRLTPLTFVALAAWLASWLLEGWADRQKRGFARRADRTATCDVGLWRYSRHPNYFFQWTGWNALALAAMPSVIDLAHQTSPAQAGACALVLLAAPTFMLWTLLHLTGIRPAEHYSVEKRPGYRAYQCTTNSFVPGPRRPDRRLELASEPRP